MKQGLNLWETFSAVLITRLFLDLDHVGRVRSKDSRAIITDTINQRDVQFVVIKVGLGVDLDEKADSSESVRHTIQ